MSDVKPERQKILSKGKKLADETTIAESGLLKAGKVMMMGSTEEEIGSLGPPPDLPDIVNDLISVELCDSFQFLKSKFHVCNRVGVWVLLRMVFCARAVGLAF